MSIVGEPRRALTPGFVRFAALGALSYLFALAQMHLFVEVVRLPRLPGYAATQVVLCCANFLLNRRWVFEARDGKLSTQGARFVIAILFFRLTEWCLFSLISALTCIDYRLAILIALATAFPLKYVAYSTGVFTRRTA